MMCQQVFGVGGEFQTPQLYFAIKFVLTPLSRMLPAHSSRSSIIATTPAGHEITTESRTETKLALRECKVTDLDLHQHEYSASSPKLFYVLISIVGFLEKM